MIKRALILLWMLFPVGVLAYHFNDGQKQVAREGAYARLLEIRRLEAEEEPDWRAIIQQYNELSGALPPGEDPIVLHQIRLAICRARRPGSAVVPFRISCGC